ncbi:hypothetical protein K449DRAFT_428324 [Hypoxylon sp. EC38]|nr:hypothetical protein K449DRAFT_428324 [Hypoxylon sp. EC38]
MNKWQTSYRFGKKPSTKPKKRSMLLWTVIQLGDSAISYERYPISRSGILAALGVWRIAFVFRGPRIPGPILVTTMRRYSAAITPSQNLLGSDSSPLKEPGDMSPYTTPEDETRASTNRLCISAKEFPASRPPARHASAMYGRDG